MSDFHRSPITARPIPEKSHSLFLEMNVKKLFKNISIYLLTYICCAAVVLVFSRFTDVSERTLFWNGGIVTGFLLAYRCARLG